LIGPALQGLGLVLVAIGAFAIATWLGFVVAGAALVLVGVGVERAN
jgi:hypothetical protein